MFSFSPLWVSPECYVFPLHQKNSRLGSFLVGTFSCHTLTFSKHHQSKIQLAHIWMNYSTVLSIITTVCPRKFTSGIQTPDRNTDTKRRVLSILLTVIVSHTSAPLCRAINIHPDSEIESLIKHLHKHISARAKCADMKAIINNTPVWWAPSAKNGLHWCAQQQRLQAQH